MRHLVSLSLLIVCLTVLPPGQARCQVNGQTNVTATKYPETPVNTLFIKHPAANDAATFFATNTNFTLDIYKPADLAKIMAILKKEPDVESCTKGTRTGDYQQFNLTVSSAKNKMWFVALFKKAGLHTVKINNNPIVEVEKM